jgi:hypothetical protein
MLKAHALALIPLALLIACSDDEPKPTPADMGRADMSQGAEDMDVTPADDMAPDAQLDAQMDAGRDAPEDAPDTPEDTPDAQEDAPDDMPEPPDQGGDMAASLMLPFEGPLDFPRGANGVEPRTFALPATGDGVMLLKLRWAAGGDIFNVEVNACKADGACQRITGQRATQDAWAPFTYLWEAGEFTSLTLRVSARSSATAVSLDAQLRLLPWQTIGAPLTLDDAITVNAPVAIRGTLPGGSDPRNPSSFTTHWFEWRADALGVATVFQRQGNVLPTLCAENHLQVPWLCLGNSSSVLRAEITRGGAQRLVIKSRRAQDEPYGVVLDFTPNPALTACPAGEQQSGGGQCAPLGTCAPGFQDGGWGYCLAAPACEPSFALDAQGRCRGWIYESSLPASATISSFWASTNEVIRLSDGRSFYTNNLDTSGGLPARSRPLIFDPTTGRWSVSANEEPTPSVYRSCPLSDGKILAVGYGGPLNNTPRPERLYDPVTDSWSALPTMSGVVWSNSVICARMSSGHTLVMSGANARAFDPVTKTWASAPNPSADRRSRALVALPDGTLAASMSSAVNNPTRVLVLRPNATAWQTLPEWPVPGVALDEDAHIVSCGPQALCVWNINASSPAARVGARYDLQSEQWSLLQPHPFSFLTELYAAPEGGYIAATPSGVGHYDPTSDTWRTVAPSPGLCVTYAFDPTNQDMLCAGPLVLRYPGMR